jgi:hypothetical protein
MQTEAGHAPNRSYFDVDSDFHLNGAKLRADESGHVIPLALADCVVPIANMTLALTVAAHEGRTLVLNDADGGTITLPSAVAAIVGAKFRVVIGTTLTSGSLVVAVPNANDYMVGIIAGMSDDPATVKAFATANTGTVATESDTVTLNRTTTGTAVKGQSLEFECIAANVWAVSGLIAQSGTEAAPFSAAV